MSQKIKKRKLITLDVKYDIIQKYQNGLNLFKSKSYSNWAVLPSQKLSKMRKK